MQIKHLKEKSLWYALLLLLLPSQTTTEIESVCLCDQFELYSAAMVSIPVQACGIRDSR
jgi:hypothetical protein